LFAFARRKRADFIGLELGPGVIRLLQLQSHARRWVIKNYATALLPAAAFAEGKIQQAELLENRVRELVVATDTVDCAAAVALPANAVISQQIALPAHLPTVEYEIAISMNLGRYFPGVNDNLYFDFLPQPASAALRQEVFLVAARQWQVDSYAALVGAAGLRVAAVDVDRFAVLRAIPFSVADFSVRHVVAVLHVGGGHADLSIIHQQKILLQQRKDVLAAQEVLLKYVASKSQPLLDYLVVVGDLTQEISVPGVKVIKVDVLRGLQIAQGVDEKRLQDDAGKLLVCAGLAMRSRAFKT
jgi:type IV pilus assembly protein PilM